MRLYSNLWPGAIELSVSGSPGSGQDGGGSGAAGIVGRVLQPRLEQDVGPVVLAAAPWGNPGSVPWLLVAFAGAVAIAFLSLRKG